MGPVARAVDYRSDEQPIAGGADPYAFYRRVGTALAAVILFLTAAEFLWNTLNPTNRDFLSFWGAGRLALAGAPAAAYDNAVLHQLQASVAEFDSGGEMPFPYAPAFLLLVMPFAFLSYPAGMAAWASATFAIYFVSVRRVFPDSGWLAAAFPPVFVNAVIGQNAFVTASMFIGGMVLLQRRPFVAGLLLGCLVLKPQLGLLLPVAFLAARQWRAIAGAAVSSISVLLLGLALFGTAASAAWLDQMPLYASIARDGLVGWEKLASVYAAARQAGVPESAAFAIHAAVALVAAAVTWRVWSSDSDWLCKASLLCAATVLISPYIFLYDTVILVIPLLWLARSSEHRVLIAILWCLPMITVAQYCGYLESVSLIPLLLVTVLVLAWKRFAGQQIAADRSDKAYAFG